MLKTALKIIDHLIVLTKGGNYEPKPNSILELAVYASKLTAPLINESLVAITLLGSCLICSKVSAQEL